MITIRPAMPVRDLRDRDQERQDPRLWTDQRKLEHSLAMAARLKDRHPLLSKAWQDSADLILHRMAGLDPTKR
jgi:hypothetical protein